MIWAPGFDDAGLVPRGGVHLDAGIGSGWTSRTTGVGKFHSRGTSFHDTTFTLHALLRYLRPSPTVCRADGSFLKTRHAFHQNTKSSASM